MRVVAEDVVARDVLLRLLNAQGEIVVVEQRLAAGIRRQREQRLLLPWKLRCCVRAELPENMPAPPDEPLVASPSGAEATRPRASIG